MKYLLILFLIVPSLSFAADTLDDINKNRRDESQCRLVQLKTSCILYCPGRLTAITKVDPADCK